MLAIVAAPRFALVAFRVRTALMGVVPPDPCFMVESPQGRASVWFTPDRSAQAFDGFGYVAEVVLVVFPVSPPLDVTARELLPPVAVSVPDASLGAVDFR